MENKAYLKALEIGDYAIINNLFSKIKYYRQFVRRRYKVNN